MVLVSFLFRNELSDQLFIRLCLFSATQSSSADSNPAALVLAGPSDASGTRSMRSNRELAAACNRCMNKLQSNCT